MEIIAKTKLLILLGMLILTINACSQKLEDVENQRRKNFNENYETFQKLEQMQRENIDVFAIGDTGFESFKEANGLKEAINNGYSYKQNNIDRNKNASTHKFHYEFKTSDGLTNDRWSNYKKLMKKAGLTYLIYTYDRPDKRQVWFPVEGTDSGYVYMEYQPPKFFNKFSDCKPIMPSQSCYILLKKNWYLYSERFRLEQD